MPQHNETRLLPYKREQMFALVADIGRYPEFLPWCKSARVLSRSASEAVADLVIGYGPLTEKFRSRVTLDAPRVITVDYLSGPLSHLSNKWEFRSAKGGCAITFHVDFDFRSPVLRAVMQAFFDRALIRMAAAFEARAGRLYGAANRTGALNKGLQTGPDR